MDKHIQWRFTLDCVTGIITKDENDSESEYGFDECAVRHYCDEVGDIVTASKRVLDVGVLHDNKYSCVLHSLPDIIRSLMRGATLVSYSYYGKYRLPKEEIQALQWVSKETFACVQPLLTKRLMVMGYVIAPELYSGDLASMYDEYIQKNTAYLLKHFYNSSTTIKNYISLAKHIFAVGKPSKKAIATIIARLKPPLCDEEKELEQLLKKNFARLYPRTNLDAMVENYQTP